MQGEQQPDPQLKAYVAGLRNWIKEIDVVDENLRNLPRSKEEGALRAVNKKEEAVKEKDLGNKFFQEKKFKEAIECYTRSFELDPESPIALANRGMAYLQLKQWNQAEKDCSDTIKMDSNFVKAYARRGTARMNLGNLEGAKQDFQKVLQLEKGNKQAQQELEKITKMEAVVNAKPAPTLAPKVQPVGETLPPKKQTPATSTPPTKTAVTPSASTQTPKPSSQPEPPKQIQQTEKQPQPSLIPSVSTPAPTTVVTTATAPTATTATATTTSTSVLLNLSLPTSNVVTIDGMNVTIPDKPPKTFFELERTWQSLKKDLPAFAKYFKLIDPASYRALFKNSLHPDILSSIIEAVCHCLLKDNPQLAFSILNGMTSVNRFGMIVLLLPSNRKEVIKACCTELVQQGTITAEREKRLLQEYL